MWDLQEHRRIGSRERTRIADELPVSWTDPATGDVYDLTRPLVDQDGDTWEVVDYDGFEPIVCEHPLEPRVTFGIADAHAEYGFDEAVTPGPKRRKPARTTHSIYRQYFEFQVLDENRVLSAEQLADLADRYPEAKLSPTRMVWDYDPEDDGEDNEPGHLLGEREVEELLCSSFDAFLEFQAYGLRCLKFRLPTARLGLEPLTPFLFGSRCGHGLSARVHGSDLLVSFDHMEADGELGHWRERPNTWLKPLLPLRADLAAGNLSAAYLGWLKAAQELRNRDDLVHPPRPVALREMSAQLRKLATLLHLDGWARRRLP